MNKTTITIECDNGSFEARIEGNDKNFLKLFLKLLEREPRHYFKLKMAAEVGRLNPSQKILAIMAGAVSINWEYVNNDEEIYLKSELKGSETDFILAFGVALAKTVKLLGVLEMALHFFKANAPKDMYLNEDEEREFKDIIESIHKKSSGS